MSEKFLIEYLGGCRGDFLCNFLNYGSIFYEFDNTSKSLSTNKSIKSYLTQINKNTTNIKHFESILKNISETYTPSHNLTYFTEDHYELLRNYNFKIIKIVFQKKWWNNIWIENVFKNYTDFQYNLDEIKNIHDFEKKLKEEPPSFWFQMFNSKQSNLNKILLDYEDLYFNFKIDKFFPNFDLDSYKSLLKKAELKKEIELYGKKYYPEDYGYIWNEELK